MNLKERQQSLQKKKVEEQQNNSIHITSEDDFNIVIEEDSPVTEIENTNVPEMEKEDPQNGNTDSIKWTRLCLSAVSVFYLFLHIDVFDKIFLIYDVVRNFENIKKGIYEWSFETTGDSFGVFIGFWIILFALIIAGSIIVKIVELLKDFKMKVDDKELSEEQVHIKYLIVLFTSGVLQILSAENNFFILYFMSWVWFNATVLNNVIPTKKAKE